MRVENEEVRIIAGRLEEPGKHSPLVVIPSTEFGARWFEAARLVLTGVGAEYGEAFS